MVVLSRAAPAAIMKEEDKLQCVSRRLHIYTNEDTCSCL